MRSKFSFCFLIVAFISVCVPTILYAQPSNDNCGSAISLTPGSSCTNTSGTLVNATYTTITDPCGNGGGNRPDAWYSFVASSSSVVIALSSTTFNKPGLQL